MKINYINQINMFMEYGRRNGLTAYERMFWLALFHVANTWSQRSPNHEWPDDFFQVSNSEIEAWSGLEERNIRSIRNRLKQIGLIDFKKGDGRRSDPEYRLFYLTFIGFKIAPDTTIGCDNAPDSAGDSVGDSVCVYVSGYVGDTAEIGSKNVPDIVVPTIRYKGKESTIDTKVNATVTATSRAWGSGLVDMNDRADGMSGLVSLPWEMGR